MPRYQVHLAVVEMEMMSQSAAIEADHVDFQAWGISVTMGNSDSGEDTVEHFPWHRVLRIEEHLLERREPRAGGL